jgi:GDPmannose 4,6-dehydratase
VTGQDGAYLAEFLLSKATRCTASSAAPRSSTPIASTISTRIRTSTTRFILHYGDLTDSTNLLRIVQQVQPDEIYNLAAQSHVRSASRSPSTPPTPTARHAALLEAIRILGLEKKTRFYQASTSELYGLVQETPQTETTPFYPRSPYAVAKLYAYWITVNYREAYGIYACNGILFNHESRCAARPSSPARSRARWRASRSACRTACTSAT